MVSSRLGWVDWNKHRRKKWLWKITVSSRLGWVDWNRRSISSISSLKRSHPVWDEWIEIQQHCAWFANPASHPVWDEWIEIFTSSSIRISSRCLIPFGMSGLKSGTDRWPWSCRWSHPVWDEWIEIAFNMDKADFIGVSSRLGWVDWNKYIGKYWKYNYSLIPFGMSGLKSSCFHLFYKSIPVSSRLGWVDWNRDDADGKGMVYVSSRLGWVDWNPAHARIYPNFEKSHPVWDEWIEIE